METDRDTTANAPETLTLALTLAITDGRALMNQEQELKRRYQPDHGSWHKTTQEKTCELCAAGAVMAQTLHLGINEFGSPGMFTTQWERVLTTINHMRSGDWGGAAELMHKVRIATTIQERAWIESKCNAFHEQMLEISDESLRYNNFRGWDEYGQWLDTMESDVIPKLQEAEHELLKEIEPEGKEG